MFNTALLNTLLIISADITRRTTGCEVVEPRLVNKIVIYLFLNIMFCGIQVTFNKSENNLNKYCITWIFPCYFV